MSTRELEQRLSAILDTAMVDGKYRPSLLTPELRVEYRRLYPLWLGDRRQMRLGDST